MSDEAVKLLIQNGIPALSALLGALVGALIQYFIASANNKRSEKKYYRARVNTSVDDTLNKIIEARDIYEKSEVCSATGGYSTDVEE